MKEKDKKIMITEKGITLCEIWKLQTMVIAFGIISILLQISLLVIVLSKL